MLRKVLDLLKSPEQEAQPELTTELATAALLSEIIRADRHADERELKAYRAMLEARFNLTDEQIEALMEDGRETAEEAVDMVQFTQVLNEQCDNEEKRAILKSLWEVAYADKEIAPIEEHTIRRIADLLHMPHSQFIKTKLDVTST